MKGFTIEGIMGPYQSLETVGELRDRNNSDDEW